MLNARRSFLVALCAVGLPLGVLPRTMIGQAPPHPPPRNPASDKDKEEDTPNTPKLDPKAILESNQKDIKKNVERLYQLASDLKTEVEKTDSAQVLSMVLLKKTEEIEKLAREIRTRAKG